MSKIELIFKDGEVTIKRDECGTREMLFASKLLESEAMKEISASNSSTNELITSLETMLLPFSEEAKASFDQESTLKMLPITLRLLVDRYK